MSQLSPAPARPRRKTNPYTVIGIIIAICAVFCGGLLALGAVLSSATPSARTGGTTADAKPIAVNDSARDGKFQFTVTAVECGHTQIGGQYLNKTAQGQFCLVHVTVTNIGDRAQMFSSSSQHAYNAAGQRYDADSAAGMYLEGDSRSFLEDINPGNTVNGILVFDIPADAKITKLELHDSMFSGGVTVTVS